MDEGIGVFVGIDGYVDAESAVATIGVGEVVVEGVETGNVFEPVPALIYGGVVPSVFATGDNGVLVGGVGGVVVECEMEIYGAVASIGCFQCVAFCSWVGIWSIDVTAASCCPSGPR